MYYNYAPGSKQAILCLDAKKAFHPTASVVNNQDRLHSFELERGTCQGYPRSPLLCALAIEPLANSMRESKVIKPISIDGDDHKISLSISLLSF